METTQQYPILQTPQGQIPSPTTEAAPDLRWVASAQVPTLDAPLQLPSQDGHTLPYDRRSGQAAAVQTVEVPAAASAPFQFASPLRRREPLTESAPVIEEYSIEEARDEAYKALLPQATHKPIASGALGGFELQGSFSGELNSEDVKTAQSLQMVIRAGDELFGVVRITNTEDSSKSALALTRFNLGSKTDEKSRRSAELIGIIREAVTEEDVILVGRDTLRQGGSTDISDQISGSHFAVGMREHEGGLIVQDMGSTNATDVLLPGSGDKDADAVWTAAHTSSWALGRGLAAQQVGNDYYALNPGSAPNPYEPVAHNPAAEAFPVQAASTAGQTAVASVVQEPQPLAQVVDLAKGVMGSREAEVQASQVIPEQETPRRTMLQRASERITEEAAKAPKPEYDPESGKEIPLWRVSGATEESLQENSKDIDPNKLGITVLDYGQEKANINKMRRLDDDGAARNYNVRYKEYFGSRYAEVIDEDGNFIERVPIDEVKLGVMAYRSHNRSF